MKINEIITESELQADFKKLPGDRSASMKNAVSLPSVSQNKSNGSPYTQYRFGLALAGAPEYPTQAAGAVAGDPLLSCYTDEELEMVNAAAEMVGAGTVKRLTNNRSEELSNTNKQSPVPARKKNKYGV